MSDYSCKGRPWERLRSLMQREGTWMCALCGLPIARYGQLVCSLGLKGGCWPDGMGACTHKRERVKHRHPMSWSADHIIPAAERPDLRMQRGNLREAHYGCNAARMKGAAEKGTPRGTNNRVY